MLTTARLDFENQTYYFTDPIDVLIANTSEEVAPVFEKIDAYQKKGYYIAGFVSYEAANTFNPQLKTHEPMKDFPLALFGVFAENKIAPIINDELAISPFYFEKDTDFSLYQNKIAKIHAEIEEGNTYQTNYTIRLNSQILTDFDGLKAYHALLKHSSVKYASYFDFSRYQILSASPELFFKMTNNEVETRPMKGTIERSSDEKTDQKNKEFLFNDEKNRSENIMIVDLLRNDLGQLAEAGSVKVTKLCTVEPYPTVWQMTSTITAQISPDETIYELFKALFPCGSITGAPKKSTMELITELEDSPRGVYCGAIGVIKPDGDMIFSVPIRTIQVDKKIKKARYGVGGGITWDSIAEDEFYEVDAKSQVLNTSFPRVGLIESLRLEEGQLLRKDRHLRRLEESTTALEIPFNREETESLWQQAITDYQEGCYKFRFEINHRGVGQIEITAIEKESHELSASLAQHPMDTTVLLNHKTNYRHLYTKHQQPT
ncbi:aminodeoxychorismate synthase component I [Vagococcus sp.]|uniref:aminodeoxychorismate synthase component I n=1 Tax=Vagococcus sp. TaxID=1933889 RepID=UPI003F961707